MAPQSLSNTSGPFRRRLPMAIAAAAALLPGIVLSGIALPGMALADGAADRAALESWLTAKAAQVENLQARARDCEQIAVNDYDQPLRGLNDMLRHWKFVYDPGARDVVPIATFHARLAKGDFHGAANAGEFVQSAGIATREVYQICERAEFPRRVVAAQRDLADLQMKLGIAPAYDTAAPHLASNTLHAIPPVLRAP